MNSLIYLFIFNPEFPPLFAAFYLHTLERHIKDGGCEPVDYIPLLGSTMVATHVSFNERRTETQLDG